MAFRAATVMMRTLVPDRRRDAHAGFSMIEMLVAVAILGMVATAGMMAIGNRDSANLRREAHELAMTLNRARLDAARLGRSVTLRYDSRQHTLFTGASKMKVADTVSVRNVLDNRGGFELTLSPSGTSEGLLAALNLSESALWLTLDPLTGRVDLHGDDPRKQL